MRVLITGSRNWSNIDTIKKALFAVASEATYVPGDKMTIVHGGCKTGADNIADTYVRDLMKDPRGAELFDVEVHEADWKTHGRAAGPLRNTFMIEQGADVCLAFIGPCSSSNCHKAGSHPSHGASGTANKAILAGIKTVTYYENDVNSAA